MAGSRTADIHRTIPESQQRELFEVVQQQSQLEQQRAFEFESGPSPRLDSHVRRLKILKSTPVGLVFPQSLYLSVIDVETGIASTGHSFEPSPSSSEPIFVTSELKWWKQKCILPPSFKVFPPSAHVQHKEAQRGEDGATGEIVGLPKSPNHESINSTSNVSLTGSKDQKPYPLAEIKYKGWQGLTRMSTLLTLYNMTPESHYQHADAPVLTQDLDSTPDIRSRYAIARTGWKREYTLTPGGYQWRAPTLREKKELFSTPALDDASLVGHGNLILENADAEVVAVYKQQRDYDVLGNLTVFLENGITNGKISLEAVVASCLAVVVYERVGWQNLLGH